MDVGVVQDNHIILDTHAGAPRSTNCSPVILRELAVGLGDGYSRVIEMTLKSRSQLGNLIKKLDCGVRRSSDRAGNNGHGLSRPSSMVTGTDEIANR
jgi:hypothetical protein